MNKFISILIFLLSTLMISQLSYSQSIQGKIIDAGNSDLLVGAIVKIEGAQLGAATDLDGTYVIDEINPGTYTLVFSYIGYQSKTVKDVKVLAGQVTKIDVALNAEGILTEEITVESTPTLANEQSLLMEQKNSAKIQDGISEQQIKRAPDAAASDVLKRVIGVNIVDDKFVFIRGTSERYSNTTLNGVLIPSTEADRKSFSFDLFPSKLLENIIIAKSFSPELPGNFSGGLVQLNTKDFVDGFTFNFETIGSYLTGTTSKGNFYGYDAGQKKILFFNSGIDNGERSIPSDFPATKFSSPNEYGKSLKNNWAQTEKKAPLNGGFQLSIGNNFSILKNPLGVLFAYTYKNGFKNEIIQRSEYFGAADTTTLVNFKGRSSNYNVLNGGILNMNYKIGDNNKISFKNTLSISSDDRTQYFEGFSRVTDEFERKLYGTDFTERTLLSTQVSGNHYISKLSKMSLTWNASYSESERNEPDTKTTYYQREIGTDGPFFSPLSTIASAVGQRFYSKLFDINRNFGVNFDMDFIKLNRQKSKFKFGGFAVGTDRNFEARLFAPINAGSFLIGFEPLDSIFRPENMDSNKLYYVETTDKSDKYTASENLYASYLMFDIPIKKLRIIAGLRYEYNEQIVNGFKRGSVDSVSVNQRNNDYLPSLNLTYALTDISNLRASLSQTVSRPELREIAPFAFIDFVTGGELSGNPDLKESLIQNYDLRYEIFPDAGEIASMSLFYKHFDQPIEKIIVPTLTSAIPAYTFDNALSGAVNYGLELEMRKKLGFISKHLKYLTLNANLTLVNSKVDLEGLQTAVSEKSRRLQGQSPYTVNVGLFYDDYNIGLSTNLLFNKFGDKISEVGRSGFNDIMENGRDVLDFSVSKTFLKNFEAKFSAKDILNQDIVFTQRFRVNETDIIKEVRRITSGTGYSLTLSYKF